MPGPLSPGLRKLIDVVTVILEPTDSASRPLGGSSGDALQVTDIDAYLTSPFTGAQVVVAEMRHRMLAVAPR